MRRVVPHAVGLADAMLVHQVGRHQIVRRTESASHTASGASRSGPRIGRHRLITCTRPRSNSSASSPKKSRTRCGPDVAVWSTCTRGRRLARRAGRPVLGAADAPAQRVVEDEHLVGAGRLGQHPLDLGVVDPPHLVLVPEILHRALVVQHGEALAIQRDIRRRRRAHRGSAQCAPHACCWSAARRAADRTCSCAAVPPSAPDSSASPRHAAGRKFSAELHCVGPPRLIGVRQQGGGARQNGVASSR